MMHVSQDSGYLQTLGGLGSPSAPLPVLLFPLCCRVCGLTLEEADLEGDKAEGEGEGDTGQVCIWWCVCVWHLCQLWQPCSMLTVHSLIEKAFPKPYFILVIK